ncbi:MULTISPECIES: DUF6307 family protein [unclassified Amycolatopsis]|uniref:DUF6307 family protein n=1 Tax=unclassified Amycolatopsis TaxID=2618356 RepID=UPI001FF1FF03|nr:MULTISPECIES: DUF6307 family protein [unclassified Amycolatopsis]UOZ08597.1 DUF6307 family protein [Amycolatopsis sp. WQ 127309]WSJ74859.1 DUF6307 family protein [Amycolatopsis sp. NBC_01307]WSK81467.1 DUF6307 family protein [Amycolatopsis sp. NBC_01286]
MTASTSYHSRYDLRVERVKNIVMEDTKLNDTKALALAVRMVHELDTVPEPVR